MKKGIVNNKEGKNQYSGLGGRVKAFKESRKLLVEADNLDKAAALLLDEIGKPSKAGLSTVSKLNDEMSKAADKLNKKGLTGDKYVSELIKIQGKDVTASKALVNAQKTRDKELLRQAQGMRQRAKALREKSKRLSLKVLDR